MSYCVNCGVELEKSIKKCPLCQTPVINPKDLSKLKEIQSPFPEQKGVVEEVTKKDIAVAITIILCSIMVCCLLLNYLEFSVNKWSLLTNGFCGLLWVATVPSLLVKRTNPQLHFFFIGLMSVIYICLIGHFMDSFTWVIELGCPIATAVIIEGEILITIARHRKSVLTTLITFFLEIGALCVLIELLIERMLQRMYELSWSFIVITVCAVIVVVLLTMVSKKKVRREMKKRFHL